MSPTPHDNTPLRQSHAAMHDAARQRAVELRREAIDAFWSALRHALTRAWRRATQARRQRAAPTTHHHPTKA